jgi:hypothetical protein
VTPDAAQQKFGGSSDPVGAGDAMLVRWSADGRTIRYATYFGGSGDERVTAMVTDGRGGVWLAGRTTSADLPLTTSARAGAKGFLAHLDAHGRLLFSRAVDDEITAMAALDRHRLAVATATRSGVGGFFLDTETDASAGVIFGMVIGGIAASGAPPKIAFRSVAGLPDGAVVFAGDSESCPQRPAGRSDGLLHVLPAGPNGLLATGSPQTFCVGGSGVDEIHGIAAAPDGSVWVTGLTDSRDFPVTTGPKPEDDTQAFLAQMDPKTGRILFATLLGAEAEPRRDIARGYAVAVSKDGRVFAAGEATGGSLFRPTPGAFRAGQPLASTDPYIVSLR